MCRGQQNVLAESVLLAMAHNVNKLHNKIQADRTGKHLFELKNLHKFNFKISKNRLIKVRSFLEILKLEKYNI